MPEVDGNQAFMMMITPAHKGGRGGGRGGCCCCCLNTFVGSDHLGLAVNCLTVFLYLMMQSCFLYFTLQCCLTVLWLFSFISSYTAD